MYKNILFDLDGTLTDPGIGITNSVAYALKAFGIECGDRRELYRFIGPPLHDSFMEYYGMDKAKAMKAVEKYREYFRTKGIYENEVYPGIRELLDNLKTTGKRLILATSKPEEFANIILEHFELAGYFDFTAGATMDGLRSKKGDVIAYALKKSDIDALSETVMIGDKKQDIIGAQQNGIDSIGVLYGYGDINELTTAGATYIAEDAVNVLQLIDNA